MPLPPPPAKRAALLASETFDAAAQPPGHRAPRRSTAARGAETTSDVTAHPKDTELRATDATSRAMEGKSPAAAENLPASRRRTTSSREGEGGAIPKAAPEARKPRAKGPAKLFVIDTNVLMHDPMCLFRFEEHDIFLPMIVLEELDGHKKGMTEVARNARQASRWLDKLAGGAGQDITSGMALAASGHREASGKLFLQTQPLAMTLPLIILAALSIVGGLVGIPEVISAGGDKLAAFLAPAVSSMPHEHHLSHSDEYMLMGISTALVLATIAAAYMVYRNYRQQENTGFAKVLENKWYVDELYDRIIVQPLHWLGGFLKDIVDLKVVDGLVNGAGRLVNYGSRQLRLLQSGQTGNVEATRGQVTLSNVLAEAVSQLKVDLDLRSSVAAAG
mgnify:CR=1 FL=1